jgi:hypothetical protein
MKLNYLRHATVDVSTSTRVVFVTIYNGYVTHFPKSLISNWTN